MPGPLMDPANQELAAFVLGSPESGTVAFLLGWLAGIVCGGFLSLVMSR